MATHHAVLLNWLNPSLAGGYYVGVLKSKT